RGTLREPDLLRGGLPVEDAPGTVCERDLHHPLRHLGLELVRIASVEHRHDAVDQPLGTAEKSLVRLGEGHRHASGSMGGWRQREAKVKKKRWPATLSQDRRPTAGAPTAFSALSCTPKSPAELRGASGRGRSSHASL